MLRALESRTGGPLVLLVFDGRRPGLEDDPPALLLLLLLLLLISLRDEEVGSDAPVDDDEEEEDAEREASRCKDSLLGLELPPSPKLLDVVKS